MDNTFPDIEVKIIKLSEKKIMLNYIIPIICDGNLIKHTKIKVRYKIKDEIYQLIYPKPAFLNIISNKFGIKRKFIIYNSDHSILNQKIYCNGVFLDMFIKSIHILDINSCKRWVRENSLKELLK